MCLCERRWQAVATRRAPVWWSHGRQHLPPSHIAPLPGRNPAAAFVRPVLRAYALFPKDASEGPEPMSAAAKATPPWLPLLQRSRPVGGEAGMAGTLVGEFRNARHLRLERGASGERRAGRPLVRGSARGMHAGKIGEVRLRRCHQLRVRSRHGALAGGLRCWVVSVKWGISQPAQWLFWQKAVLRGALAVRRRNFQARPSQVRWRLRFRSRRGEAQSRQRGRARRPRPR